MPMKLINSDNFLKMYLDSSMKELKLRFAHSNLQEDFKKAFRFNYGHVERSEGVHRYYIFLNEKKKIAYIGSSKQFWKQRRSSYPEDVTDLAFDEDMHYCIIGYVTEPRKVKNWGKRKEELEFLLLNILNGRKGFKFLNSKFNLNIC